MIARLYCYNCSNHSYLNFEQCMKQMRDADATWKCNCGSYHCNFDDTYFEMDDATKIEIYQQSKQYQQEKIK